MGVLEPASSSVTRYEPVRPSGARLTGTSTSGLRIGRPAADGKPRYVLDISPVANRVTVGPAEALDVNEETDLHGKFYGCVQGAFFNWIVIFADGRVTHCCYDAHGDQVIGDLRTQSLTEIIEGSKLVQMQELFDKRDFTELPRCAECFKHGGESSAWTGVLSGVQALPEAAKDVVRKVLDVRYR